MIDEDNQKLKQDNLDNVEEDILKDVEDINLEKKQKCCRCTGDIMLGLTYVGRIIITLYTFHGLFFIYNLIIQYVILFAGVLYDIKGGFFQVVMAFIYILFSFSAGNILVIPTYEFLTFPFMTYRNPFIHVMSFIYIIKNAEFDTENALTKNHNLVNAFLILIEVSYLFGLIGVWASIGADLKDYVKIIILFLVYVYYFMIFFCYFILLIYIMLNLLLTSYYEYNKKIKEKEFFIKKYWTILINSVSNLDVFFKTRAPIPDVNLLYYMVNPYLIQNYEFKDGKPPDKLTVEEAFDLFNIYQKIVLTVLSIIIFIILIINNSGKDDILPLFYFIGLYLIMTTFSIGVNFPFCFRNKKTFGHFFASTHSKYKLKLRHPIMLSLIRVVCNAVIILFCFGLVFIFFFMKDTGTSNNDLREMDLTGVEIESLSSYTNGKLLPNMCFSSLYYFPIPAFLPFINDAYYYENNTSSLDVESYKKLFYSNNIEIQSFGDLVNDTHLENNEGSVKMIQYNVRGEKAELTILSIKGTSYKKDIFLDIQLYFPSVLLNILSTFSLSQRDTLANKFIEFSLSIPYRIFFQFLIIDKYINLLRKAYMKNRNNFYKNVIITGHSLGGGLAKILARFLKLQAISLSGPGMNAFNSLWEYHGDSEFFGISSIDLVPDMDLVPRVEVSGGTIYRIICTAGVFGCHGKERSLCEILVMCRHPNYKIYCKKIAKIDDKELDSLVEKSELNKEN